MESVVETKSFEFEEKELESEESMWALYERWRLHYGINRTPEEMQIRFSTFMKTAKRVTELNKKNLGWTAALNKFGDGDRPCCCKPSSKCR